jgi:cyanophycinase
MTAATGTICLQGGNELTDDCRAMDRQLLSLAPGGPVVVVPLASDRGTDYSRTAANASRYYADLGAEVVVPADPRRDPDEATRALATAGQIVLTGGSPRRLRDALVDTGLDELIRARWRSGALVMGSSAGAMVACATTLLPQWRGNPQTGPGLGLVTGHIVVPHYDGKRSAWVRAGLDVEPAVLGIPECSGVLVDGGRLTAVGVTPSTLITATEEVVLALG